jgi:hypothetical protein
MSQPTSFGRRTPATLAASPAPRPPSKTEPSPSSLGGKKSAEDKAELRAFKAGFRRRRFIGRGGWRWVGGVCFGVSGVLGFLGMGGLSALFVAVGCAALIYGFVGTARSEDKTTTET